MFLQKHNTVDFWLFGAVLFFQDSPFALFPFKNFPKHFPSKTISPQAVTTRSFLSTFFQKSGGVKGQSPLWDFKGQSPLMNKNSKQNFLTKILP